MQFSEETLGILKSFSAINPGVIFKAGTKIRTMSPQKTVIASANVAEEIDGSAAVYDLGRFLSSVSLCDNPDIAFEKDKFVISDGKSKIKYTFASENMVISPPAQDIPLADDPTAVVQVGWDAIQNVIRAAGILQLPEIAFTSEGDGVIKMSAVDTKNPTADRFDVVISTDTDTEPFNILIKVDNMKQLPADYMVTLSTSPAVAHFKSPTVQYWIATEAS